MTDVETLQECRLATIEERALNNQITRLLKIEGPQGIGSQAIEPAGDRKTNNRQAANAQRLEGLIDELVKKREENIDIIQRAERVIERIVARKDRIVIRYYYVEGQSEYEIARELDASRQWVNQRRTAVLDALTKNISGNSRNILKWP